VKLEKPPVASMAEPATQLGRGGRRQGSSMREGNRVSGGGDKIFPSGCFVSGRFSTLNLPLGQVLPN
jgi:hypothetical protein